MPALLGDDGEQHLAGDLVGSISSWSRPITWNRISGIAFDDVVLVLFSTDLALAAVQAHGHVVAAGTPQPKLASTSALEALRSMELAVAEIAHDHRVRLASPAVAVHFAITASWPVTASNLHGFQR